MIDFEEGQVLSLSINGVPVKIFEQTQRFDGHHIYLNTDELKSTSNQVEISFSHPYGTQGNGLHRFKDPVDSRVYLYSDFEPYHAHQMFPCFDQPDLKATFKVTAEAPSDWQVISNTLQNEISPVDGKKRWVFPTSPIFSTYVFALHAGPYAAWKSDAQGIPIRLFARKSLAKYVDHDEWLKITRQGLEFYGIEFGLPYPFFKYDQIIVPDFNQGAMENVGAVTFSERYIFRSPVTRDRHRRRADTILHEMAHMWFGDLVTMKWWNGLWLNESFATFMAANAVEEATEFSGSWQAFFAGMKEWAYWEDQLVTTHPIELPVPNTDSAEANFDGITYGKGAAVLKQLRYYLGPDDFREGLQRYFQKYSYKNTNLSDFTKMLTEASSEDLTRWQRSWLQTAGLNSIRAEWKCEADPKTNRSKVSEFNLLQTPAEALRPHRTQIALFYFPRGRNKSISPLEPTKPFDVFYSSSSTPVPQIIGQPCPDLVFPNFADQDYVKVELDPISQEQALKALARIKNPLTRQMIWHTLWVMVLDGQVRPQDYADAALSQGKNETDTVVLASLLKHLVDTSANHSSVLKFLKGDLRNLYLRKFETWTKTRLLLARAGSDHQIIWFQTYLESASSAPSIQYLKGLLSGRQKLRGFPIDQERRWKVIRTLARNGDKGVQEAIAAELLKDPTDMGQKEAIAAEAMIPHAESKKTWLTQVSQPNGALPLAKLREAMNHYQVLGQEEFIQASADTYFEKLPQLAFSKKLQDQEHSKWFAEGMFPSLCNSEIVKRTTDLLNAYPKLPASVIKTLNIQRQEEERCIRAQEKSAG
jgi:aminopeptidase N